MPLVKIDLVKGNSNEDLKKIMDAIHKSKVTDFISPEEDCYQILTQHEKNEMILEDTGLGFLRDAENQMAITVISKKRSSENKQELYSLLADLLLKECNIDSKNLLISIVENTDSDWSFGFGEAQFITGKL